MAKGQKRGNREIRKPKKEKAAVVAAPATFPLNRPAGGGPKKKT